MVNPLIQDLLIQEHLAELRREVAANHLADEVARAQPAPTRRWPTIRWTFGLGRPGLVRLTGERRHVAL